MLNKSKYKIFVFVLVLGLVSLTGVISWNPIMGQTLGKNQKMAVYPTPVPIEAKDVKDTMYTDNAPVMWNAPRKGPRILGQLLNEIPQDSALTADRMRVKVPGESGPVSIIIIHFANGTRLCIGKPAACKEAMS